MNYQQARSKILDAYFKDEIKPMDANFCFCGTLAPDSVWRYQSKREFLYPYSEHEYEVMERALFMGMLDVINNTHEVEHPRYEDALFEGMSRALSVLEEIHRQRGENVDAFVFTKRELVKI